MRALSTAALAAALLAGLAGPAAAQPSDALTLFEAIQLAKANSLAAQASRQNVHVTEAERAVTVSNVLPTVGLRTSANYQELPGSSARAFGGGGFGNIVGFPASGAYVDSTVSASQTIFDAFATRDQLAIIEDNLTMGKLAALQAEQDAMQAAAVAYFDVLRAEGLANVSAEAVRQATEHMRLGELRLKAGTGTRAEVLQQRAQLANAQGQLTQARNAVNLARLTLSNALNAPVGDRPLAGDPAVPPMQVDLAKGLKPAIERRTEVKQLEAKQHAEETRVSLESRALWPNLAASGSYAQRNLSEGQWQAGVTLNWTIFDSFRVRNRMASALEQARVTKLQTEQTRQRVALEIRQQYQSRLEAEQRVAVAREGLASAQEAYRLALKRYQVGIATPFEVTDVQTTMIQSSNNYIQAVNDLRAGEVRLARALGYDLGEMLTAKRR